MQAKCLTSFFTQKRSGVPGQMIQIDSQEEMDDLVRAGYVEEQGAQTAETTPEKQAMKANTRKKSDDSQ